VKTAIPELVPFYLDSAARELDRVLFFGNDAYTYFTWLYDMPLMFKLIDRTYTIWAAVIAGVWVYCFITEKMERERRYQYVIAMIVIWVVAGNFMAIALSSAGPCFYGTFPGDAEAFAPMIAQLASLHTVMHVNAYEYQSILMEMYESPEIRFNGISALPSLHVGTSFMLLLLFWKTRFAREFLILFNIIIYVGSIVLGWHYAIDGLISIPVALGCWWVAGKISRWIGTRSPA